MARAILALADGRVFEGKSFGANATVCGEICFNTSMTGYQEILTDPSYKGQIVAMTAPQIGNTGINLHDEESSQPHVRGFVVEELSPVVSSWRSQDELNDYLQQNQIPAVEQIDTRSLTLHLRTKGAMTACLTSELSKEEAIKLAQQDRGVVNQDFVQEVTTPHAYDWDPQGTLSRPWTVENSSIEAERISAEGEVWKPLSKPKYNIVAYDLGIKRNILRQLRQHGFQVHVVPATTSAEEVLAKNPQGIFLSNGPGDPSALPYVHKELAKLIGKAPIFGICLGHQMLGHALGGNTYKLPFGHRGGNHPVQDLRSGKVAITSQNHGFAVCADSLPEHVEVTHVNLNDNTVEGLRHKSEPVFSVQYHPEAAPGPHDANYFFAEFANLIENA